MMMSERGMYVRYGKLSSPEAEQSGDYYQALRDRKDKKRESIAEAQASVDYLDYNQVSLYISRFYQAGNSPDRKFWRDKVVQIDKVYGEWLDPYIKEKMKPVLHWKSI